MLGVFGVLDSGTLDFDGSGLGAESSPESPAESMLDFGLDSVEWGCLMSFWLMSGFVLTRSECTNKLVCSFFSARFRWVLVSISKRFSYARFCVQTSIAFVFVLGLMLIATEALLLVKSSPPALSTALSAFSLPSKPT